MNQNLDIPASQKDCSLPMVINLRGDEESVDDFCISAEQAMEILGIKRSRLTQISGRELRVGKIRRDRYLRPVYRMCDLQDYQEWTRATATHQSSSKAIELALDGLDDRFNDLLFVFNERLQNNHESGLQGVQKLFVDLRSEFLKHQRRVSHEQQEAMQVHVKLGAEGQSKLGQKLGALSEHLVQLNSLTQELDQRFALMHQDVRGLLAAMSLLRKDIQVAQSQHSLALETSVANQNKLYVELDQHKGEQSRRLQNLEDKLIEQFEEFFQLVRQSKSSPLESGRTLPRRTIARQQRLRSRPYLFR